MNPSMPFISVIVATARASMKSLVAEPDRHHIDVTFSSLADQDFTDFEVVVVDSLYKDRNLSDEISKLRKWPFKWSVVSPVSWWLDQGMWALQAAFNAGAVASRGRNLLFCGDCGVFPSNSLSRSAELLKKGYSPHFVCLRRHGGHLIDGRTKEPMLARTIEDVAGTALDSNAVLVGDTRLFDPIMLSRGCITPDIASWQWFYGYGFISRNDFFTVNGWSELFDGDKALGDVEMGSRLEMCGRLKFYMERTLCVYEEEHNNIALTTVKPTPRSNYDLIWLYRFHSISRAHTVKFSHSDMWRVVRGTISGLHGWPYKNGHLPDDVKTFATHWMNNQPIFTLDDHCAGA